MKDQALVTIQFRMRVNGHRLSTLNLAHHAVDKFLRASRALIAIFGDAGFTVGGFKVLAVQRTDHEHMDYCYDTGDGYVGADTICHID